MDDRHYMWVSQGSQGSLGEMGNIAPILRARVNGRLVRSGGGEY